jgi:hypothetical protein
MYAHFYQNSETLEINSKTLCAGMQWVNRNQMFNTPPPILPAARRHARVAEVYGVRMMSKFVCFIFILLKLISIILVTSLVQ